MELLQFNQLVMGRLYKAVRRHPHEDPLKEAIAYLFIYNGGTLDNDSDILFTDSDGEKRTMSSGGSLNTATNSAFIGYLPATIDTIAHYYRTMGIKPQSSNIAIQNHFNFMP
jgi:hypothetical protein